MSQHSDDEQPEIDKNGIEWWTVNYRDAPRDIVPPEPVDPEVQRQKLAEVARRHAAGERFYFTPNEQLAYDADGRPTACQPRKSDEITAFGSQQQQRNERGDDEAP